MERLAKMAINRINRGVSESSTMVKDQQLQNLPMLESQAANWISELNDKLSLSK